MSLSRFRLVSLALLTALVPLTPTATPAPEPPAPETAMTIEELMRATALDELFSQFGASIHGAPDEQGLPMPTGMRDAWTVAVRQTFDADQMHAEFASLLEGDFTPDELAAYADFYGSDFGIRVTEVERAVTLLPPDQQLAAQSKGLALAAAADDRRNAQIDEMLELVHAELTTDIVAQSVRGMLIGMSLTDQQGDIEVPWEEIDAQLEAIMPGIADEIAVTQRAIVFYAYENLSEADLDEYLLFLRTMPAQKLYAMVVVAAGEVIHNRMRSFGENLVTAMNRTSA
jgi:hypothetical protein